MPTYEYLCNQCDHAFEVVQSFSDSAIEQCPKCDGRVRKVYNNVGVVFKGSGFYKTDSRATNTKKTESKSESKSEVKSESKSESKSEVKTEVKSESKPSTKKD
jgi:putative FmdB family regulatory protein